jgi:hypothetical protein
MKEKLGYLSYLGRSWITPAGGTPAMKTIFSTGPWNIDPLARLQIFLFYRWEF